ncbi:MAG TPA: hypothetical protein VLB80_00660 [Candidatus Babeliales bacterium]|nr:hypothetical protein [Candidatus Babeliales bacterium]
MFKLNRFSASIMFLSINFSIGMIQSEQKTSEGNVEFIDREKLSQDTISELSYNNTKKLILDYLDTLPKEKIINFMKDASVVVQSTTVNVAGKIENNCSHSTQLISAGFFGAGLSNIRCLRILSSRSYFLGGAVTLVAGILKFEPRYNTTKKQNIIPNRPSINLDIPQSHNASNIEV